MITDIAEYVKREMGVTIPPNYPLVGIDFNATGAGIHIDGVIKNEEIYNIFDTEKILNRPMTVVITDKSGLAGIAHWVNTHLTLTGEQRVDKRHPGIAKIYKWVMDQYAAGRVTSISHGEIERQARRHLPEYFVSDFDRIKWQAREMAAHLLEETIETPQLKSMRPETDRTASEEAGGGASLHPVCVCHGHGRPEGHQKHHPGGRQGQI